MFHFIFLILDFKNEKATSNHDSRSLKWESNGELAQKDLSELIERLKNVENEDTSSELSRLGSKSDTTN